MDLNDPRRRLQVAKASSPSLRMATAPKVQPKLEVASAPLPVKSNFTPQPVPGVAQAPQFFVKKDAPLQVAKAPVQPTLSEVVAGAKPTPFVKEPSFLEKVTETAKNVTSPETLLNFTAAANEKFFGGIIKSGADLVNLIGSGLNQKEADKKTADFLDTIGQTGPNNLTTGTDRNSTAFKAGETAGNIERVATDIATAAIPGAAVEKGIRGVLKAKGLLQGADVLTGVGRNVIPAVVGGAVSTGINQVQNPTQDAKLNFGSGAAIDTVLAVAGPTASALVRVAKEANLGTKFVDAMQTIFKTANADELAKEIVKETDPDVIKATLNVDDVVAQYLVSETDPNAVKQVLGELSVDPGIQLPAEIKQKLEAEGIKVEAPQATAPVQKPKPVDPLAALKQEALKYKTADEFVNSQSIHHGTTAPIDKLSIEHANTFEPTLNRGIYTTADKSVADTYATRNGVQGKVFSYKKPESGKVFDYHNDASLQKAGIKLPDHYRSESAYNAHMNNVMDSKGIDYAGGGSLAVARENAVFDRLAVKALKNMGDANPARTWEEIKNTPVQQMASNMDETATKVLDQVNADLHKQGFDFASHKGGLRTGSKQHDVYIALHDNALQPQDTKQLTDLYNQAHAQSAPVKTKPRVQTQTQTETRKPDTLVQTDRTSDYNTTNIDPKQYVKEMTDAQKQARKAESDKLTTKTKNTKADFKEKFIDDLAPIEDRFRKATKGMDIPTDKNITYQLDRSRRAEGISQVYMKDNGLADILQKVPDTKEFDQYLIARHAKELDPTITTGRNKAKDAALVKQLDEKYKPYAEQVYKYNQKLLDTAVEYGLISKKLASSLKKQYPDYVPLNRIFNEDELASGNFGSKSEASVSKQKAVQRIKGSERTINSPLESIIDKTRVVVEQGEKNKSAALLASYKDLPDNPFNLKEIPANETIGSRHTISFLDKGKKRTFEVDKDVAEAAKHMSREDIGLWGRIAAIPARILRAGATSVNVGFAGANVVKDVVGAAINSEHPFRIADPRNFGNALAAALRHDGKAYAELMREGVAGTSFDMYRNPNKLNVGEIRSHKNIATRSVYNLTHPSQYYRTLENTIGRSEDFGRALQYYSNKSGYKAKGLSEADAKRLAADQARHNSTNFFRHGSTGKNVNLAIPYWNAGVQGARIQTRRFIEHPVKMTAKMGFVIAAPSAMIAMNNYADPEKRKVMENIPDYEKQGNIIIVGNNPKFNDKTGRWDDVYKIPVPPQHIGIHTAIQDAVKSAVTGQAYDVMKNIGNIAENYTTVNPTNAKKTISNYTPQALKLAAEPLTNTNFFTGEKIVPDSLKNLAKKDQKYKSTSGVAQVIGNALDISPLQVDNSIKTAFGGAGQNVINLVDIGLAKTGVIKNDEVRGRDLISTVVGRFYGAKGITEGQLYFNTLDKAAEDNKLAGRDLAIYNSLVSTKIGSNGEIEGKTERDALNKYQNLANSRSVAKTVADAANAMAKQTGKPVDPLYKLPLDKQMQFYNIKAQNRDSQDQNDLENRAGKWYKDITKERAKYFDTVDFKADGKSQRVKYPEASPELQKVMDTYFNLPKGDAKYTFLDQHPEVIKQFERQAKYTNDVRKGQGVNELRSYPQASKRVQELMDAGSFKDPEVSKYLQDLNVYNLTKDAAQAQIKGNDLSSKALKSAQSLGKYSIVKNPDGTYSLAYSDSQGGGTNNAQSGASSGFGGGRGGSSSGSKRAYLSALLPSMKLGSGSSAPKFSAKRRTKGISFKDVNTPKKANSKKITINL